MSKVAELLQRAQAATSLADFGDDSFREGMEILVAAIDAEARLTDAGRAAYDTQLVDLLANRLKVEHWYRLHPEIDEQEIVAPLIGLGLPRTGSSALSCMLAEDPAVRSIRGWEAQEPCPPPETATQYSDPRIAKAEAMMERRARMFPRMQMMLPSTATTPTECQTFMAYDFKSQLFQAFVHVPSYVEWLNYKADLVPTYRYVKRVLKILQWRCPPRRWRLKNPSHSLFIDALAQVFPDARFWMTHRDVANVIPSVADLYFELTRAFAEQVDKVWLGKMTADFCELGMRRMMAFRDAGNDHRFFDIYFAPFQKDPYPILTRLYAWLGEELTPTTLERMEAWRRNSPRDKHGSHTYDVAEFGIDPGQLRRRFAFYSERYSGVLA
jgi:sulfotransferase family protein